MPESGFRAMSQDFGGACPRLAPRGISPGATDPGARQIMDDVFPSTHDSWLCEMLDGPPEQVERAAVALTARYHEPLRVYFEGSSFGRLGSQGFVEFGEAEDLVHGFLVSRLARAEFLAAWRKSGMRLRRFVINGFIFYLREQARGARRRRNREQRAADAPSDATADDSTVDFDRAWAVAVIREASQMAAAALESRGRGAHWELFTRHFVDGVAYGDLVEPFGLKPSQAASAARDVAFELRRCMRAVLSRDGITEADLGPELALIESLLRPDGRHSRS